MKTNFARINIFCIFLISFLFSGCLTIKDSPAPGCIKRIGLPVMGGCFGKTIIQELTISPEIDCLKIEANNCNGGVLEITNQCEYRFNIGSLIIEPSDSNSWDFSLINGELEIRDVPGNFSDFIPETDTQFNLEATLNDQIIEINFTKTAPLCQ